jgi:hypothetical protein
VVFIWSVWPGQRIDLTHLDRSDGVLVSPWILPEPDWLFEFSASGDTVQKQMNLLKSLMTLTNEFIFCKLVLCIMSPELVSELNLEQRKPIYSCLFERSIADLLYAICHKSHSTWRFGRHLTFCYVTRIIIDSKYSICEAFFVLYGILNSFSYFVKTFNLPVYKLHIFKQNCSISFRVFTHLY